MRPLRLLLDGFGCYRETAEADFSDVDFFALVGPTGSGKSTVIDGLCFALYGTVPRWRKENVIAQALAPAANACRVCLVFEAAGKRYGVVRALSRDRRGQVHTKEARLELLDGEIPPDAPIEDILAASIQQVAEGPDQVKSEVQAILGLTYEHFTQSVLLPQGRFSEFLQAKATDRQDLLVELLAFGVYNTVGQKARERARLAVERRRVAQAARDDLADATEEAETHAAGRVGELGDLSNEVEQRLESLHQLKDQAEQAARQALDVLGEIKLLAAVRTPAEVPDLARRISEAGQRVAECKQQRDAADKGETEAQQARDSLPDRTRMATLSQAYTDRGSRILRLEEQERTLRGTEAAEAERLREVRDTEQELQHAQDQLDQAVRSHAAADLAQGLSIGENCPVCRQPVASLPHHPPSAELAKAREDVRLATERASRERKAYQKAASDTAAARKAVEITQEQIQQLSATLTEAPSEADVAVALGAIETADGVLRQAQAKARNRRAALSSAEQERSSLDDEERLARAKLGNARDSVVHLGAPAIEATDLAAAWQALTVWAQQQHAERSSQQPDLDKAAAGLEQQVTAAQEALIGLLAEHGITEITDPARAAAAVATHRERAASHLQMVRENRRKAARLDQQISKHKEEEQVASLLGQLLRATSFERWLCGEALDSLVAEASETLMELSSGQYQLDRDDRNELVVIDYQDAGARRPVHTLSGGETFQASLALALALSRQVIGLSAGMRDLNSMFLDEGFGTLDEDTLETVATTLERLAADSDRMVGVITHVPALAERVPVRFVVSRAGATSTLRKERV